ncbi:hypothetical protein ACIQMJ_20750 [Actinosynnema sp. NPDC091369]
MRPKILAVLAATFAAVLIAPSPASAHSTDDWVKVNEPDVSGWKHRVARSTAGGVLQVTDIHWDDYRVVVSGGVWDLKTDGYCGAIEIRYEIADSAGNWSGHWHHRPLSPAVDCSTDTLSSHSYEWKSRYPTRGLGARACHAGSDGAIIHCESTWH